MKILIRFAAAATLLAAAAPLAAHATTITPGGGPVTLSGSASVTIQNYVQSASGTATAGAVTANWTEDQVTDSSNSGDLTFLIAVSGATGAIQTVTISGVLPSPTPVNAGFIAGITTGPDTPLTAEETSDGSVVFTFNDLNATTPSTEYMVIQTAATSLPLGSIAIATPGSVTTPAATPEPASLTLLATGVFAGGFLMLRRRRLAL